MKGRVWVFGDNISTDHIIPGRFMDKVGVIPDEDWKKYCFIDHEPRFSGEAQPGDIIVAGKNFGTGSSREVAPFAIKMAGISCIIAQSYARIFFRNCINLGLPAVTADPEFIAALEHLDETALDLATGKAILSKSGREFKIEPLAPFAGEIVNNGGLLKYALLKRKNRGEQNE